MSNLVRDQEQEVDDSHSGNQPVVRDQHVDRRDAIEIAVDIV
jgi:hypothetical protein